MQVEHMDMESYGELSIIGTGREKKAVVGGYEG